MPTPSAASALYGHGGKAQIKAMFAVRLEPIYTEWSTSYLENQSCR